jgi:tRNA nucleotidyltransferase (CCA-adding enzyme)
VVERTHGGDERGARSPAESLARDLHARLGGSLAAHGDFATASLQLDSGLVVDVASARSEAYAFPGALPQVRESALVDDLSRRDFSLNALAVRVYPGPPELLDPFGGYPDLEARRLRILHPLSFVEDPTRIVRGARLAGRLGLRFDDDTLAKMPAALRREVIGNVSGQRLRAELELTLAETRVAPALGHLVATGAMKPLYGLVVDDEAVRRLDAEREEAARRGEEGTADASGAAAALMLLLASTPDGPAHRALVRFHWPKRIAVQRERVRALASGALPLHDEHLQALDPASRRALAAWAPALRETITAFEHAPERPKVRGRDVVLLGLPPGPQVGAVLARLQRARAEGAVTSFDEELELARTLVERERAAPVEARQAGDGRDEPG